MIFFCPSPPPQLKRILPYIFFMTTHLNSHWTTDTKPEMLSGVQTGNVIQHVEYNIRGIAHVHAYRKDDIFMQKRLLLSISPPLKKKSNTSKKICPCLNCIQRLHYPNFEAFLNIQLLFFCFRFDR